MEGGFEIPSNKQRLSHQKESVEWYRYMYKSMHDNYVAEGGNLIKPQTDWLGPDMYNLSVHCKASASNNAYQSCLLHYAWPC